MKKTFSLKSDKHKPARVLESIKADVNKYFARERRKPLAEGVDYWDFDCRCGKDADSALVVKAGDIGKQIDKVIADGSEVVYVEILAKPGVRTNKLVRPAFKKNQKSEIAEDTDDEATDEDYRSEEYDDEEEFDDDWDEEDLDEEELRELEELDQKSKKKK
ncbi:MAG: DUF6172 family protein [Bdellovibrio sp.]|jgi:hypothetical protein